MFEWFQPHQTLYGESRISYPIQNLANLTIFRIDGIASFSLDSITYEGMGLAFNKEHQAPSVPQRWWC